MTIDEMLDRVADNLGVKSPETKKASTSPRLSTTSCQTTVKSNCTGGCSEHKCHSSENKCSVGCDNHGDGHKCGGHCHGSGAEHKCGGHCREESTVLNLTYAKKLADGLEAAAEAMGVKVVIAIVNEGGNLMCLHAMDDSYIASIKASQDKAFTAVALKMPTHVALKESRGGALDGYTNGNGILMLGGGFPLEKDGRIYGGIGISGGTKEQDTLLAQIGAEVFRRL